MWELYGGTERQGACVISGVEWMAHKGSVGKIGETAKLRIIGEDGNDVKPGETGEIYFLPNDGAGSTYHYLGATPKRRPDGWESLGDIGRLDEEAISISRPLADMVLRGGANIYPAEVEAAVSEHPKVRSCVVVGLPDPEFGQRVHAILELADDTDAQEIADGMGDFLKTGSAATSIRKASSASPPRRAMIPERSAARCCATSAPRGSRTTAPSASCRRARQPKANKFILSCEREVCTPDELCRPPRRVYHSIFPAGRTSD